MEIGRRVRAKRRALDLSQDALARRADVSLSLINQMERGIITDPHVTTLTAVASALGVPVSELLEEPTDPKAEAPSLPDKEEKERRGDWVVDSLDRTVSRWVWEVEEKQDPRDSYVIAVACLEISKDILRFDLPGATLQERVPEAEVDERVRWLERLFDLSQRAQKNYATSPQADSSEIEALEQAGKRVLHVIEGGLPRAQ